MALIECPECGKKISDQAKMCPHCGMPIEKTIFCPECGEEISSSEKICPVCGFPVKKNNRIKIAKKIIFVIGLALVVCVIGVVAFFGINYMNRQKEVQLEIETDEAEDQTREETAPIAHNTTVDFEVLEKNATDTDNQVILKIRLTNNFKKAISRVNGILVISDDSGNELKRVYCRLEDFDLMPKDIMEKNDFEVSLDPEVENDEKIYELDISKLQFRFIVNEVADADGNVILPKTRWN